MGEETFTDEDGDEYVKPTDKPEGAITSENLVQPDAGEGTTYQVPSTQPKVEKEAEGEKDLTSIAEEVRAGKWGVGQDRRLRLSEAGYNAQEVEAEVRRLLNP